MKCLDELASLHPKPNFVVASGSLPPGVPEDFFRTRCEERQDELREGRGGHVGSAPQRGFARRCLLHQTNLREFRERPGRVRPTIKRLSKRAAV